MTQLSDKQIEQIAHALDRRRDSLLAEIREAFIRSGEQHYIDLTGRVTDFADESVADLLADVDAAIADRQVREIREIEAARSRLSRQDFGLCLDCGGEIAFERLLAYPMAQRCFSCQRRHEKTYAGEASPSL